MRLIKDLGLSYTTVTSKVKKRFGIYECPVCGIEFRANSYDVKNCKVTKCIVCAQKLRSKKHGFGTSSDAVRKALYEQWKRFRSYDYEFDVCDRWLEDSILFVEDMYKILNGVFEPNSHIRPINSEYELSPDNVRVLSVDTVYKEKLLNLSYKSKFDVVTIDNNTNTITCKCTKCGDIKVQGRYSILEAYNCQACETVFGFNKGKPAILYYLRIIHDGNIFYKIGITNRTVAQRFNAEELSKITVLRTVEYVNGHDAYNEEQKLLEAHKEYKVNVPILVSGNTEIFCKDILEVDYV